MGRLNLQMIICSSMDMGMLIVMQGQAFSYISKSYQWLSG
jgi:hypothetical protein